MQVAGMLSLKRTAQEDLGRTLLNRANGVERCFLAGTYRWAKLAVDEIVAAQLRLSVPVRLDLVHKHRAVLPAVPGQIALRVAGR
jgi:hypothetical protein